MENNEVFKKIKEGVKNLLSDQQINEIIENWNFEEYETLPQIVVTDNPIEFEGKTRQHEINEYENGESNYESTATTVLLGNLEPGIEDWEMDEGKITDGENKMAEFSLNQPQVAIVKSIHKSNAYGKKIDRSSETIYVFDSSKYLDEKKFSEFVCERNRAKLYELIKEKVGDKLTDEQIKNIVAGFNISEEILPEIEVTSDPYKFEANSREDNDAFVHSWAGSSESYRQTDVVIGDYKPGKDSRYQYSKNGDDRTPKVEHQMSDFSVNDIQVAVVTSDYLDNYNGEDLDEHNESIQIYLPDRERYPSQMSFKQMVLEERYKKMYQAIKDKVGDELNDEQIKSIVEKFDLENPNVPKIEVTDDPYKFEKNTKRSKDVLEHSWAGTKKSQKQTDVVIGDYEPGIDSKYQYSENGDERTPKEGHQMSDFSVNDIQVAVVMSDYSDHYNGADLDEHKESIQIYLPDREKYPSQMSFKQMVLEERYKKMYQAIKDKVGDGLNDEQIKSIVEKFDLENPNVPEIEVTDDPYKFEKNTKRSKDVFKHSWAGTKKSQRQTDVVIGDYEPGIDSKYQYSENGDERTPKEEHQMSDFSVNDTQVAVVTSDYLDYYNGANLDKHKESIQIYLPDREKYPSQIKFKELLEKDKSPLAIRETQLRKLEEEEKIITQAEKLIKGLEDKDVNKGE